jgi:hypothetical protein
MQTEEEIRQIDKEVEKEEAEGGDEEEDVFGGAETGNGEQPPAQQVNGKDQNQQQQEVASPSDRLKTIKMVNRKNGTLHTLDEDVK